MILFRMKTSVKGGGGGGALLVYIKEPRIPI